MILSLKNKQLVFVIYSLKKTSASNFLNLGEKVILFHFYQSALKAMNLQILPLNLYICKFSHRIQHI